MFMCVRKTYSQSVVFRIVISRIYCFFHMYMSGKYTAVI